MQATCCGCNRELPGVWQRDNGSLRVCRGCMKRFIISLEQQMRQFQIASLEKMFSLNMRQLPSRQLRIEAKEDQSFRAGHVSGRLIPFIKTYDILKT